MNLSKWMSQLPGLGSNFKVAGKRGMTIYGDAIPNPRQVKMAKIKGEGCLRVQAMAPPRRGPLQGVAKKVARVPL
jgi:hypothetical protein